MKPHLGHLACVGVLFLIFVCAVSGQPGCRPLFSAEEACAWPIQSSEYVFLGKVMTVSVHEGETYRREKKIAVEVEAPLKGNLGRRIDLIAINDADDCFGGLNVGTRRIFTASSTANEKASGLVSRHWSNPINDDYPKRELDTLLAEIRAVLRKVKQPRLVGAVVEKGRYPDARWLRLASGAHRIHASDPILAGGHADVVVTARRKDGLEFRTATGAGGYYVFNELPHGMYEVSADLPEGYNVHSEGTFHTYEGDRKILQIDDGVCSKRVGFMVQLQGGVKLRIRGVRRDWSHIFVHLYSVAETPGRGRELFEKMSEVLKIRSSSDGSAEQMLEHHFQEVPVGRYVVRLTITTDPNIASTILYYPGTLDVDKADIITVETAKTNTLELAIPELF